MRVWLVKDENRLIRSEWFVVNEETVRLVVFTMWIGEMRWEVNDIFEGRRGNPFRNRVRKDLVDKYGEEVAKFLTPPMP